MQYDVVYGVQALIGISEGTYEAGLTSVVCKNITALRNKSGISELTQVYFSGELFTVNTVISNLDEPSKDIGYLIFDPRASDKADFIANGWAEDALITGLTSFYFETQAAMSDDDDEDEEEEPEDEDEDEDDHAADEAAAIASGYISAADALTVTGIAISEHALAE